MYVKTGEHTRCWETMILIGVSENGIRIERRLKAVLPTQKFNLCQLVRDMYENLNIFTHLLLEYLILELLQLLKLV